MSTDPFRSPAEELAALTKELAEVRTVLRDLGQRLGQIERHVRRAFGVPSDAPSKDATREGRGLRPVPQPTTPTMSAEEALSFFKRVVEVSRAQGRDAAEDQLERLEAPDLRFLARELGLPGGSKLSKRTLVGSILGRVNESLMLSKNTNVTPPLSAQASRSTPDAETSSVAAGSDVLSPRSDK